MIKLTAVSKEYPRSGVALRNVSLHVRKGDFVFLTGHSGAGKSTLLNLIQMEERPTAGEVRVSGFSSARIRSGDVARLRRSLGVVFQDFRLLRDRTAEENVAFALEVTGARRATIRPRVQRLMAQVGLAAKAQAYPDELSGGERQRVAIGRAVLAHPRLLLMDEPLVALDGARKEEILPFIERLPAEFGLPILYVTHAIEEALRLASDLVLIERGRVVAAGPIEEVTSRLELHEYADRLDAGAVLRATVSRHETARGLTHFIFAGGELRAPLMRLPEGAQVNIRIRARDVSLALEPPRAISILNILPGRIVRIGEGEGPQAQVLLDVGAPLWARITRASVADLELAPGKPVYALLKAVAVDSRSLGRPGQPSP